MEGSCSTGQSPQWGVVPVEEEEEEEEEEGYKHKSCRCPHNEEFYHLAASGGNL
jgi:hypothetical protein